ncbi:hypothetical protein ACA910_013903 [Epithemia clementina (nom. ined.)]
MSKENHNDDDGTEEVDDDGAEEVEDEGNHQDKIDQDNKLHEDPVEVVNVDKNERSTTETVGNPDGSSTVFTSSSSSLLTKASSGVLHAMFRTNYCGVARAVAPLEASTLDEHLHLSSSKNKNTTLVAASKNQEQTLSPTTTTPTGVVAAAAPPFKVVPIFWKLVFWVLVFLTMASTILVLRESHTAFTWMQTVLSSLTSTWRQLSSLSWNCILQNAKCNYWKNYIQNRVMWQACLQNIVRQLGSACVEHGNLLRDELLSVRHTLILETIAF